MKNKILEYIRQNKKVDKKQLSDIDRKAKTYESLGRLLIEAKFLTEEELLCIFSQELKIPFLDLKKYKFPANSNELISREIAFKYKVLPIYKIGGVLTLASSSPLDIMVCDDLKIIAHADKIDLVLCREEDVAKTLSILYKSAEDAGESFKEEGVFNLVDGVESKEDLENLISESKHPPIVRAIDLIIYNALKKRASDIHIEPCEDRLLVKYRIDGVLSEEFNFSKKNQQAVLARLKIISALDITESRLPQDGRFRIRFENREIDFRVSSLPTHLGEKFVLRVLDRESLAVGLNELGFSQGPSALFEEAVRAPFGIILVTGPTGSGKSTTLYSIISKINTPDKNIITIEDPVEYRLEGITQIQVSAEIGLTFAVGLRSVLRQSPDVIMVGEIRDTETADIAVKASLTGEVILSTLHTNSAVGAITRLRDMGIEPFLLASSLVALTAQRLVRKLCPKCKEKYQIQDEVLQRLELGDFVKDRSVKKEFYRPGGCDYCSQSGWRGRIAVLEIILLDDKIREMIVEQKSEEEIVKYARKFKDFRSLKEDGFLKCIEGTTSVEEILRVTSE
ncbi:MAG: GspE/PulE family protein [Candidatus Omnitrophota bacterium]